MEEPQISNQHITEFFIPGSLSVNVSITSGKDQFMNAGQLNMSSSSIEMLFKVLPLSILALFLHSLSFMEFQFL